MPIFELTINNETHRVEADADMPLLWALRDLIGLTGTKYGCGIGQCGSCTVHIDGNPTRSCLLPIGAVGKQTVVTIEGLAEGSQLHPLQAAWIEEDVAQCGYCQAGQIMTAAALLRDKPNPTDQDIDNAMTGNYCRCGTYIRIRKAIHKATSYYNAAVQKAPSGDII